MWSGGGDSGLGNTFDSVPAFPESGIHLIIVYVLNTTRVLVLKKEIEQVTIVRNMWPQCAPPHWQETNQSFMTVLCPNQYPDLEAIRICPKQHNSFVRDE